MEIAVRSVHYKQRVLPRTTRLLAIAAAFVAGISFLSFTGVLSLLAVLLIFASNVQPRFPQFGRLVSSVIAPLMSVYAVPIGTMSLWETAKGEPFPHDLLRLAIASSWMLSPILLIWCNAALVAEAIRERRSRRDLPAPALTDSPTN